MAVTQPDPSPSAFLDQTESRLLSLAIESSQADWVYATYITDDSEALSSKALARLLQATAECAKRTVKFPRSALTPTEGRKVDLLRLSLPLPAPSDPKEAEELTALVASMTGAYSKGRYTPKGRSESLDLIQLGQILRESRDPAVLKDVWTGWHRVGREVFRGFPRYVELANRGARELGFQDTGDLWRSKYDMSAEAFQQEVERLWEQVRPLYRELHAFVRRKLSERYGPDVVPPRGPIPAHLLGNMWAQSWEYLLPVLLPAGAGPSFDLTSILKTRKVDPVGMVKFAERFFVSLGLPPLPETFWTRSLFSRPQDREVVCHASAWDLDFVDDLRIKMCIETTGEEFRVIHHELGHNYYQRAYAHQPFLFRDGAHDGFHEAIGDTIALSVTPEYLRKVGLLENVPGPEEDLGLLLASALEKVAFLPFGLLIDQWRWQVFDGRVGVRDYNRAWWSLREKYQGVAPPEPRGPEEFDPGAKFHVPANTPYMRYFLAHILQFQFHRAFAKTIGWTGPLHRASIYESKEVGARLRAMLEMGQSEPWPEALMAATGERRMDGSALLEYYRPLEAWLRKENAGAPVGW